MQLIKKLDWREPLHIASLLPKNQPSWVLLYSGMNISHSGRYSYLALDKTDEITASFDNLAQKLSINNHQLDNAWFGYFGYGLKNQLENLKSDAPSFINADDLWFARFATIIVFDHIGKNVEVWGDEERTKIYIDVLDEISYCEESNVPRITSVPRNDVNSNMSKKQYLEKVLYIKNAIKNGDIYQANLTRKFFGEIQNPEPFEIFRSLCHISPAPYSAFVKNQDLHIISSSPERFIKIDASGVANIRPIKGSIARNKDFAQDQLAIKQLENSEKDRAENLMIVDLSRNDLSRNCVTGSVKTDELFKIETYATVHHMVSSVTGQKKPDADSLELIKGCFPPGSMTGAPKIKAMEICSDLENMQRGIYSGALGWLGGDGSADLSVVIRTIILKDNKFEFQVGGAIVNDSSPEGEFNETMLKARAVANALGIEISTLEKL